MGTHGSDVGKRSRTVQQDRECLDLQIELVLALCPCCYVDEAFLVRRLGCSKRLSATERGRS